MAPILLLLGLLAAIFLIVIVLIQNPKGGGLNSTLNFTQGASQLLGGAAGSADLLEKITYILAGVVMLTCLIVNLIY